jgi:hypothetical protein
LHAYKRQPQIERRFEQFKTDYVVAPVFLKDVARIEPSFRTSPFHFARISIRWEGHW